MSVRAYENLFSHSSQIIQVNITRSLHAAGEREGLDWMGEDGRKRERQEEAKREGREDTGQRERWIRKEKRERGGE